MSTSTSAPRRALFSPTGLRARSTQAGCSGSARISAQVLPAEIPQSYLPETHWLQKLRENKSALFLKYESHFERFIAYDSELAIPIPVRIRGGPDEYTLQNLTNRRLLDVAVIAPTRPGLPRRLARRAARGGGREARKGEGGTTPKKPADPKQKAAEQKKKADELFSDAEAKTKQKEEEIPPLPAEGDATVRARVDQFLNQPVTVTVEQAPRREVLNLITRQARLRYEVDDRTLAKEQIDLSQPTSLKASGIAARDALADVLGNLGLSYRSHRGGQALRHHGRPARRGYRQEGRRDRRAARQAGHVAATETSRPLVPRAHPRRAGPAPGGAGPARRCRSVPPGTVRLRFCSSPAN